MRAITESEFNEWKAHPVTKAVMQILSEKREELRQQWEGGSFTDYSKETTVLVNVGNLGTCKGYAFITDLTYEGYITEIDDGEQVGAKTPGSGSTDQSIRA
jgi:hypothetical protein